MEEQFKQLVENSKSILILLPTKPFFDQVAAALGLYLSLREKKDVQVVSSSPMTVDFNRIVGINKITQEMGNKNLVIRFLDYKPDDIERIKYDLDQGQMFLTIIPKPSAKAPAKDQVEMHYAGVAADTIFIIGGLNDSHFPQLANKDLSGAKIAHIGIKDIQLSSGNHPISLARPASSVCELVYSLLKSGEYPIDRDVASDLLMGMENETDNFGDTNATADTFMAAADLMKRGARRFSAIGHALPGSYPPGAIPSGPVTQPQMRPQMPMQQMQPGQMPQQMPQYPMPMPPGGYTQQPQAPRPVYQQSMSMQGQTQMPQMPRPQMLPMQQMPQPPQAQPQQPNRQRPQAQPRVQQQQYQPPADEKVQQEQNVADAMSDDEAPEEWLSKPKIYKGTSVN